MEYNKELVDQVEQTETVEEKTFTQEQVNEIVETRLAKERRKYENIMKGMNPELAEIEEKNRDLNEREMIFEAKQVLKNMGLSEDLLQFINTSSKESVAESAAIIKGVIDEHITVGVEDRLKGGPPPKSPPQAEDDAIRRAFGLL